MHIRIKTAEEFRSSHVTIEVTADGSADIRNLVTRLSGVPVTTGYDPERAAEVMAENYGRASEEITRLKADLARERAAHVCTSKCSPDSRSTSAARLVTELAAEVERLTDTSKYYVRSIDGLKAELAESWDLKAEVDRLKTELVTERKMTQVVASQRETARNKLAESRDLVALKNSVIDAYQIDFARMHELFREATDKLSEVGRIVNHGDVTSQLDPTKATGSWGETLAEAIQQVRHVLSSPPSSQA